MFCVRRSVCWSRCVAARWFAGSRSKRLLTATKSGTAEGPWAQRDRHVEKIDEVGRQAWQKQVGYRQQARVEGTVLRYKRTLGCALQARGFEAQAKESMIGSNILNRMLELGRSDSVAVTG